MPLPSINIGELNLVKINIPMRVGRVGNSAVSPSMAVICASTGGEWVGNTCVRGVSNSWTGGDRSGMQMTTTFPRNSVDSNLQSFEDRDDTTIDDLQKYLGDENWDDTTINDCGLTGGEWVNGRCVYSYNRVGSHPATTTPQHDMQMMIDSMKRFTSA